MEDTGLENELLSTETEDLPSDEERTYTMILHDEKGDNAVSLYGNTGEDKQDLSWEPTQVTESELSEIFSGSDNLQNTFGSFDNYMSYIEESSDMIESQDWFSAEGIDNRGTGETIGEGEDFGGVDVNLVDDNRQSDGNARQGAYASWMNSEENQALMQKYGIPTEEFTNEKGDRFRWTGTGYARTYKMNRTDFGDYVLAAGAAALMAAAPALAAQLVATTGMSAAAAGGLSSSILSLTSQAATTGDVDINQIVNDAIKGASGGVFGDFGEGTVTSIGDIGKAVTDAINEVSNGAFEQTYGDVVWEEVEPSEDSEGEYDENGNVIFDPEDVQTNTGNFETEVDEESGGGGSPDETDASEDTNSSTVNSGSDNQYEVIEQAGDGSWIVRDSTDGDLYVVRGQYAIGDFIPEADMVGSQGVGGDLNATGTNTETDTTGDQTEETEDTDVIDVIDVSTDATDATEETEATEATEATEETEDGDSITDAVVAAGEVVDAVTGNGENGNGETGTNGDGNGNDGTGEGDGGDGNGDGNGDGDTLAEGGKGEGSPQWSDLFRYTTIQNPSLSKYAPTIGKVRSMFNDIS